MSTGVIRIISGTGSKKMPKIRSTILTLARKTHGLAVNSAKPAVNEWVTRSRARIQPNGSLAETISMTAAVRIAACAIIGMTSCHFISR